MVRMLANYWQNVTHILSDCYKLCIVLIFINPHSNLISLHLIVLLFALRVPLFNQLRFNLVNLMEVGIQKSGFNYHHQCYHLCINSILYQRFFLLYSYSFSFKCSTFPQEFCITFKIVNFICFLKPLYEVERLSSCHLSLPPSLPPSLPLSLCLLGTFQAL